MTLALASRREDFKACHAAVLLDRPGLRGRVVLAVAVGPEGLARVAAVIEGLDWMSGSFAFGHHSITEPICRRIDESTIPSAE